MKAKDEILNVRISGEQKERIKAEAKKQDVTVPQYVIEALDFYSSFNVHFLETIHSFAQKLQLPMPKVIQQLLTTYIEEDVARMEVSGSSGSQTYRRAFQFDENGLIEGIRHAKIVKEQVEGDLAELKKKLTRVSKTGEKVIFTDKDVHNLAGLHLNNRSSKKEARL